jgi:F0F1-type ATP synthase epsilon subunit
MADTLHCVIRTPHELVVDRAVLSARVPTPTGQVGLRPHGESLVLVIEPGVVVLRCETGPLFAATAGGLLQTDRTQLTLCTPVGVASASRDEMLRALDTMLSAPGEELAARRKLEELEDLIVRELGNREGHATPRSARG